MSCVAAGGVPGRAESLEAPAGAGRAPLLVFAAVLVLVAVAAVVGWSVGWFALLLAPALLVTLWVLASVVAALRRARGGEEGEGEPGRFRRS